MAIAPTDDIEFLWKWRKYLLLLATLVASVTYGAGLNPPGGVWSQDHDGGNTPEHGASAVHPPAPPSLAVDLSSSPAPAVYPFRVGDPVLVSTYSRRYTAFFYCNAAAFVASLVIIMFLLDRRLSDNRVGLTVLRSAMLLDLLGLMAAFAAGACRSISGSIYVSALFAIVFVYVAIHLRVASRKKAPAANAEEKRRLKEQRKFLLLLATFATPLAYGAGLVPPGGFWSETQDAHRAGAPLLHDGPYKIRYHIFFYANANSFVASLAIIMLLMSRTLSDRLVRSYALLVCVLVELVGLMTAYAVGSCRWIPTTVYIVSLVGAVLLYIVLVSAFGLDAIEEWRKKLVASVGLGPKSAGTGRTIKIGNGEEVEARTINIQEKLEQTRSLVLLLASLAATVTYQAGLSPPGGVWPQGHLKHIAGNPVLHDMHPKRYVAFYHCNTVAFVASVVVIIIVQSKVLSTVWGAMLLKAAMILDLFGLMGAYVAGSCRDTTTTIFVAALAVAVFIYTMAKVVGKQSWLARRVQRMLAALLPPELPRQGGGESPHVIQLPDEPSHQGGEAPREALHVTNHPDEPSLQGGEAPREALHVIKHPDESCRQGEGAQAASHVVLLGGESSRQGGEEATQGAAQVPSSGSDGILEEKKLERKRKFLLQLAILAATVTYQTGLNPPGGFWTESNGDRLVTAGDPILLDHYGVRYQVFFYCNATGFMASVTVILLLVNQTLSKPGIRSKALHVCVIVGLLGLMGAYAAGSCRKLRTSVYVFALVAAVVAFLVLEILLHWLGRKGWSECLPERLKRLFSPLSTGPGGGDKSEEAVSTVDKLESEKYENRKYLMVLGILAASVTYQAGLAPPGGTWGDDDTALAPSPLPSPSAHPPTVAGNPILLDFNAARYQAFFYCNATSFVASVVVILLLLQRTTKKQQPGVPLRALQTAVVLDLLGLLGAYAAGSCRDWETSSYVIALVAAVVVFTMIYVLLSFNVVRAKAEKLTVWKYFSGKGLKYSLARNDHDQHATNGV
ncbi:uncharacterized protein LOC123447588 [Hordeum vulgare subsp. vulgare]|uniref:uncharacterized protein LOC123447588 n=1 Tax=Hordeum vulgare subsp. vulgare TaxID=112509 RepID=UPI001D1A5465|nr:uncharacterized protein LOC123447588 [Hordeum vulgare subsp. vulgare]